MNKSPAIYLARKGVSPVCVFPKARARAVLYASEADRTALQPAPVVRTIDYKRQDRAVSLELDHHGSRDSGFVQGGVPGDSESGFITDDVDILDDAGSLAEVPDLVDHGMVFRTADATHDRGLITDNPSEFIDAGLIA